MCLPFSSYGHAEGGHLTEVSCASCVPYSTTLTSSAPRKDQVSRTRRRIAVSMTCMLHHERIVVRKSRDQESSELQGFPPPAKSNSPEDVQHSG
jgi:hypothetical protein